MRNNDINIDDEIQILGQNRHKRKPQSISNKQKIIIYLVCASSVITTLICSLALLLNKEKEPHYQQIQEVEQKEENKKEQEKAFIEILEETVNDVPMYVYIPHNASMELTTELPDKSDSSIIFVAQAADFRADNQGIVGDYVLAGNQLARGQRKEGFCAIIDNQITIGMATKTDFLSEAIAHNGYFFRQYPLVNNSTVVDNEPKGKSIRRALAIRNKQVLMVESRSRESFHDFAQALVDIGISDAIYLVGESAFGWYYDKDGTMTTFGKEKENLPGTNYLIWRAQ